MRIVGHDGRKENSMSAPHWRWSLIRAWVALTCVAFIAIDSTVPRGWLLFLVFANVTPATLLWLWNDDGPLLIGSLHPRRRKL